MRDWDKFVLDLPIAGQRWTPGQAPQPSWSYCTGGPVVLTLEQYVLPSLAR